MEETKYYLVFTVDRIPDLTLTKYSVMDGSSVRHIMDKHSVFLRQLHRLGSISEVYFHLLYYYDADERIPKGHHLMVAFYATSSERRKLEGIREFLTTSVLSVYYDFHCYEVCTEFELSKLLTPDKQEETVLRLTGVSGLTQLYGIEQKEQTFNYLRWAQEQMENKQMTALTCEIASDANAVLSLNALPARANGQILFTRKHIAVKSAHIVDNKLRLFFDADDGQEFALSFPYSLPKPQEEDFLKPVTAPSGYRILFYFEPDGDKIVEVAPELIPCDAYGNLTLIPPEMERRFPYRAFLTKKDYYLPAQNRWKAEGGKEVRLFSIMEWEPSEDGRLYNVLKLMEGYQRTAALRVDLFPVEHTQKIRENLPYAETRKRISDRTLGKDDNSEAIVRSWDRYLQNLMKFPQFFVNVVAMADSEDIAVMLADSVAAEAVKSGTYLVETDYKETGYSVYDNDDFPLSHEERKEPGNYVAELLSLYTLEELRPMFSLPILYPGESIECLKETDPQGFPAGGGETISLGVSALGHDVDFPIALLNKHAFIAGVPGAGKTNTMLHLVTSLWRDARKSVPFLVLEPAKQEYRALAKIKGMEQLRIFSPGADTYFPLHINPFQFPVGLTLSEHIANLNAIFAGAFYLPSPSPHFIDACIEKVYLSKGWNINERNTLDERGNYRHEFPTLQELYDFLRIEVENSHYHGETKGDLQSILEVRVGSLLKREIGNVYNVRESILKPEEWLDVPAIIELEALGEGPANFMSLLLSTLIRETLKVRKTVNDDGVSKSRDLNHVIFYEEAHNLIGPNTDDPSGESANPKIAATKYLVKMLAEVRALGQGIVIADQLPTAMAPEVLKNTGLKIAHRITAQDDRGLLGGTMSATPDQLEEQGAFGKGWALIFYEDLQKPYKMRVHEWDAENPDRSKYESPSNRELFQLLQKNPVYLETSLKSANIMREKMELEYQSLEQRASAFQKAVRQKHLSIPALDRDLRRLCWDYSSQYYAAVTMAKNYAFITDLFTVSAIHGFFSLFRHVSCRTEAPDLIEILIKETQNAMRDTERFVSLGGDAALSGNAFYDELLYEAGDYWINWLFVKQKEFKNKAKRILAMETNRQEAIQRFCAEWTQVFLDGCEKAKSYSQAVERVAAQREEQAQRVSPDELSESERLRFEAAAIKKRQFAMDKALHALTIDSAAVFNNLNGEDLICLMKSSVTLRTAERELVNYADAKAPARLSGDKRYPTFRKDAAYLEEADLRARTWQMKRMRQEQMSKYAKAVSKREKEDIVWFLLNEHNQCFAEYASDDVDSVRYRELLADFYFDFVDDLMKADDMPINMFLCHQRSFNQWQICLRLAKELKNVLPRERLDAWYRIQWKRDELFAKIKAGL